MPSQLFGIHGDALTLRNQRMGMIASNIANSATPGYKARDLDFNRALTAREAGAAPSAATAAATRYRLPVMDSLDGNTVDMATEQLAFSENAVSYAASLEFVKGRIETVTRALRGD